MRKPAARSSSSCSMASTSSMRARESAERSSVKLASIVMRLSSISRMSASRSRMIRSTSSASTGLAGVSDTMVGDRLLHAVHDAGLGAFGSHPDGGVDVAGVAGTVRDHTAALDRLQGDVAGEAVGHDDIGPTESQVAALDVPDEAGQLREQVIGPLAHL